MASGWPVQRLGRHPQWPNIEGGQRADVNPLTRAIFVWRGSRGGGGGRGDTSGGGGSSGGDGTASRSSSRQRCGLRRMSRPTLEARRREKSRGSTLTVGVLGSHGGSTDRPVLLSGTVPAHGSGTRHDACVRPSVCKECGALFPMRRDAVRSLPVDAAA